MPRRYALILVLAVCLPLPGVVGLLCAQEEQTSRKQATDQLDRLRREIQETERRLNESRSKEKDLLGELESLDREISLRGELISKLEQERARTQKDLDASERELAAIRGNLDRTRRDSVLTTRERGALADLVKRRAVYTYKYFRRDALKATLTSGSLLQWLTRQKYLRELAATDRSNLGRLQEKNVRLAGISGELVRRQTLEQVRLQRYREIAAYKEQLLAEESSEARAMKARRGQREDLLKRLRKDRTALNRQLDEKKEAAARVESLIKSLESKRAKAPALAPVPAPPPGAIPDLPFAQLRGKLLWPANGKVVSGFGLQRHETLSTVTENPGIDIEAAEGSPVRAVCSGEVTKITWLRGYGNTVIVDHRDGYYTVYAHLGQIQVREGQAVKAGESLGQVGLSGTMSGPRLHFEIWAQREKQDPMLWLGK